MIRTTVGQLMVNQLLPEDLRRPDHRLDKKGLEELFAQIVEKHPDRYREIAHKFYELGGYNAQAAGTTVTLDDLIPPPAVKAKLEKLRQMTRFLAESNISDADKDAKIQDLVLKAGKELEDHLYDEGLKTGNNLALQAKSGSRGNKSQLKQIVVGDMLVSDHKDRIIPVPILRGYAEGLEPAEYFAASYGARKGTVSTKMSTADSGYLGKQLAMAAHRLVVTEKDCGGGTGLPVPADDPDNAGALLAQDSGPYKAGTVLTPKIVKELKGQNIVVRSPITCRSQSGVCAKCAGVREKGRLPDIGDNIGMAAAQAIGEKISQGALSAKHGGGTVGGQGGTGRAGFEAINSLVQIPKSFEGAATVAQASGRVTNVLPAPQGGSYVTVGDEEHYVPPEAKVLVQPGDAVDAGDLLSDGVPNPADVVRFKGVGEGRRQFVDTFRQTLNNSGVRTHRRNLELLARGLINHVRVTDLDGVTDALPDDIVPYDVLARSYRAREDAQKLPTHRAVGKFLEQPVLHYSIGTPITKKVSKDLETYGVGEVLAHDNEPPFQSEMVRAMEHGLRDPNPLTRLGGSYLERGLLDSVHRSRTAPRHDTSFYPSLVQPTEFGKDLGTTGKY